MGKSRLFLLRQGIAILLIVISGAYAFSAPEAHRGIINLRGWDFDNDGIIALQGQWEFYWNKLLTPDDFKDTANKPDFYIYQPSCWADANKSFVIPTEIGFATYRLKVIIPHSVVTNHTHLGIRIEDCHTSFKVWINGSYITSNGNVSSSPEGFVPRMQPVYEGFSAFSDTLDIVIQVANFLDQNQGGIDDQVYLGTFTSMRKASELRLMIFMFTFGILFFMICYHLMLYFFRRQDKFNLSFMLTCSALALLSLWEGERIIFILFPEFPLALYLKLWYCTPASIGLMIMYQHHFYPGQFNKIIIRLIAANYILNVMLALLLPIGVYTQIVNYFLAAAVLTLIALFIVCAKCMIKKLPFSGLVFAGILIPIIIGINDILYAMDLIETGYYGPIGFLTYVFTQSIIISYRFSHSFSQVENLTLELERTNVSLEKKVQNRTTELIESNRALNKLILTKDKFISILTQDVRNTFQALGNLLGILESSVENNDCVKSKKITGWINKSISDSDDMLEKLLKWNDIQSGKTNHLPGKRDVNSLVTEILYLQNQDAIKKEITINTDVERKLSIWADQTQILLVLNNLISNAIKFTSRNGSINIKAYKTGNTGVIQISDTGVGISEENIDRLFKIETAFSTLGTENEKGSGIGLLLCYEIMIKHKGSILASSIPGKGSTFMLHLPLKDENK